MHAAQLSLALAIWGPALLTRGSALLAARSSSRLAPRANPCSAGGTPILYKEYRSEDCPPANTMDASGNCPAEFKKNCVAYCEVRETFTYAVEQPIDNTYCHGPTSCSVSHSSAKAYTWSGSVNAKWLDALGLGITGGYSSATTTTDVHTTSITLTDNFCGYFTFLPIVRDSCGTMSEGVQHDVPTDHCDSYTNTPNVCTSQPYRSADGSLVLGDTIFVKTNCSNRERLPMEQQDPAYQHDGVAAPQSVISAFLAGSGGAGTPVPSAATSPVSTSATAKPTCNCNENGCSADSPACCANGTC